jgi:hypothetical protein
MQSFVEAPISLAALWLWGTAVNICFSCVTVQYKVKCSYDTMLVEFVKAKSTSDIYLELLPKHYNGKLSLRSMYQQGLNMVIVYHNVCVRMYVRYDSHLLTRYTFVKYCSGGCENV